jgi:hypothetical protein
MLFYTLPEWYPTVRLQKRYNFEGAGNARNIFGSSVGLECETRRG